jgi:hypothetical protein
MNGKDLADLGGFESQMFHIKQWVYIFRMWVPVRRWVGFLKATLAEVLNELLKVNSKIKFRSARTSRPTVCKKRRTSRVGRWRHGMVGRGPIYGWPLRLTRVGCEGVDIWKKKGFRLRAAVKQIWRRPYWSTISRGTKRKVQRQRGEERKGEKREKRGITQTSMGMKTQLTFHALTHGCSLFPS